MDKLLFEAKSTSHVDLCDVMRTTPPPILSPYQKKGINNWKNEHWIQKKLP
jgi:hypothetical protein